MTWQLSFSLEFWFSELASSQIVRLDDASLYYIKTNSDFFVFFSSHRESMIWSEIDFSRDLCECISMRAVDVFAVMTFCFDEMTNYRWQNCIATTQRSCRDLIALVKVETEVASLFLFVIHLSFKLRFSNRLASVVIALIICIYFVSTYDSFHEISIVLESWNCVISVSLMLERLSARVTIFSSCNDCLQ